MTSAHSFISMQILAVAMGKLEWNKSELENPNPDVECIPIQVRNCTSVESAVSMLPTDPAGAMTMVTAGSSSSQGFGKGAQGICPEVMARND